MLGEGSAVFILQHVKLNPTVPAHATIIRNDEAISLAASDQDAIAIASVSEAERRAQARVPIRLLSINGFPASSRTIQNHTYPLSRPLMLVTRRLPDGPTKEFIEYAASNRVLDLQLKHGVVPYQD